MFDVFDVYHDRHRATHEGIDKLDSDLVEMIGFLFGLMAGAGGNDGFFWFGSWIVYRVDNVAHLDEEVMSGTKTVFLA